ncbi:GT2 family glycosyltransferase [Agromyces sp. 3263]|uniref:glycosyltransferase family 2 protein n=1 Tax=Agromyces sp. 3263 TaxID=2817750 RepID=UPI002858C439|nr:glycosyltransferase [Agromyces sp. 3263]MDR6904659.1 GT2 family glycosyltransferase [Agromyces sp. 3263]
MSDVERDREAQFGVVDALMGQREASTHGRELPAHTPMPFYVRYPRGAMRRVVASPLGPLARIGIRRLERERWRLGHFLARRRPVHLSAAGIDVAEVPGDAVVGNAMLASTNASHLVLVRPGSEVTASGLAEVRRLLEREPGVELVYGDSRSARGVRFRAPAFSPVRLREEDYLGPAVVLNVEALRTRGGFRAAADGAHVLDIALRTPATAVTRVREVIGVGQPVDRPLEAAGDAAARVVSEHLEQIGVAGTVTTESGYRTVEYPVLGRPLVSIIMPTRGSSGAVAGSERTFVVEAVRGICERTTWGEVEIVLVADDATPQAVIDEVEALAGDRLVLVRWSEAFNFSAKMNRGAAVARGDYLLMLNDDVEVVTPDWIERMLGLAQQDGIGMVGAMLFFDDGSVQHLGHIYQGGGAGHVAFGVTPGALRPLASLTVTREVSGVTAACALLPADVVREVGGFSPLFPGNYNDVDLSLKVRSTGRSVVCTGAARLYHFESRTREATVLPSEFATLARRWDALIQRDEYSRELER